MMDGNLCARVRLVTACSGCAAVLGVATLSRSRADRRLAGPQTSAAVEVRPAHDVEASARRRATPCGDFSVSLAHRQAAACGADEGFVGATVSCTRVCLNFKPKKVEIGGQIAAQGVEGRAHFEIACAAQRGCVTGLSAVCGMSKL